MKRMYKLAIGALLLYETGIIYYNLNTFTQKINEDVETIYNELIQEDPDLIQARQANQRYLEKKLKHKKPKVKIKGIEEIILE